MRRAAAEKNITRLRRRVYKKRDERFDDGPVANQQKREAWWHTMEPERVAQLKRRHAAYDKWRERQRSRNFRKVRPLRQYRSRWEWPQRGQNLNKAEFWDMVHATQ